MEVASSNQFVSSLRKFCRDSNRNLRTIALQAGGTAEKGNAARNILFENNLFTGSASQNLALTNVVGAIVRKNRFIAPGISGGPGTAVIDVEPNTNDVVDGVLIEDNLIDATNAPIGPNGPQTIFGIVVNALNPTTGFRNVRVVGNTVIGSPPTAPFGRISYAGILVRGAPGVVVERNTIQRVPRGIVLDYGASATVVRGNTLLSCGSGGTGAIEIGDSSNNVVIDNIMENAPGEMVYSADPNNLGSFRLFAIPANQSYNGNTFPAPFPMPFLGFHLRSSFAPALILFVQALKSDILLKTRGTKRLFWPLIRCCS